MTAAGDRTGELAALYESHQRPLQRIVASQVRTSGTIVEDACQTAWTVLCGHPDVALQEHNAMRWLVTTATREAWKRSTHIERRETPAGAFLPAAHALYPRELPEPTSDTPGPCEVVIAREQLSDRAAQLKRLTEREWLFLYLRGLGYSYTEMATLTASTARTVERQVLRGHAKLKDTCTPIA